MPVKKRRAAKKGAKKRAAKKAVRRATTKKRAAKRRGGAKKRAAKKRGAKKRAAKKSVAANAPTKRAAKKRAGKRRAGAPKKRAAKKRAAKKKVAQNAVSGKRSRIQRKKPKPKQKNNLSIQNIKRIDSDKTHGWQVHVCRNGVLKTKLFSDQVLGGKRVALTEAKKFRDQLRATMTQSIAPAWQKDRAPRTNTGHLGVSYIETHRGSGEVKGYVSVTARVSKGRAVNRKFSVDKVGYDKAIAEAVRWRRQQLNQREESEREAAAKV